MSIKYKNNIILKNNLYDLIYSKQFKPIIYYSTV